MCSTRRASSCAAPQQFGMPHAPAEILSTAIRTWCWRREECDRIHAEITDRDYEWCLRAI